MYRLAIIPALSLLLCGCGDTTSTLNGPQSIVVIGGEETAPVSFNTEGLPTISFSVPDMHCEVMCTPKVKKTLAEQPGAIEVEVDLDSKTAVVAVDPDLFDSEKAVEALVAAEFPESAIAEATEN